MKNETIKIREFTFRVLSAEGEEVYGAIIDAAGWPIKGTSGWYRTNDASVAADLAVRLYELRMAKGGVK